MEHITGRLWKVAYSICGRERIPHLARCLLRNMQDMASQMVGLLSGIACRGVISAGIKRCGSLLDSGYGI